MSRDRPPAVDPRDRGAPPAPVRAAGAGTVAAWLARDILLVAGRFRLAAPLEPQAWLIVGDRRLPLDAKGFSFGDPGHAGEPEGRRPGGCLLLVRVPDTTAAGGGSSALLVRAGQATLSVDLSQAVTDLKAAFRSHLASLESATRAQVIEFLTGALSWNLAGAEALRLGRNLLLVREALRERLPYCDASGVQPQVLHIDAILAIDPASFYIRGWMHDQEAEITSLTAVAPEGVRTELLDRLVHHPHQGFDRVYGGRPGHEAPPEAGFTSFFTIAAPSAVADGWKVEMRNAAGVGREVNAPRVTRDVVTVRRSILEDLTADRLPAETLMSDHVFPAVSRLHERLRTQTGVRSVVQYGRPVDAAEVTIVVRLDQRIDFVEHHLAQFARDPEVSRADLVYVLDSPEWRDRLGEAAAQLFELYRVPFRVLNVTRHAGFAAATNMGVAIARSGLIVLLGPTALPDRPGWLGRLARVYHAMPDIGGLGPKLLKEDESIQNAGLEFFRPPGASVWQITPGFAGFHRRLPAANVARRVPALSATCLMIQRATLDRLGGLRGLYVQGAFEVSDLCLRLAAAGRGCWYLPEVELYDLDEQPFSGPSRRHDTAYDQWVQTHLWDDAIDALTKAAARVGPPGEQPAGLGPATGA